MNDLTKRMGELRDSPAGIGAWARLYGSEQEYGKKNVTLRSTSVQVGADYQILQVVKRSLKAQKRSRHFS